MTDSDERLRGAPLRAVAVGSDGTLRCPVCVLAGGDLPEPLGPPSTVAVERETVARGRLPAGVDTVRAAGWVCDDGHNPVRVVLTAAGADVIDDWQHSGWVSPRLDTGRREVLGQVPAPEISGGETA